MYSGDNWYAGLAPFLPEGALEVVSKWLPSKGLSITLTNRKSQRLGAFILGRDGQRKIILNVNQTSYSFLITLAHEVAHMQVSVQYGQKAAPHGKEWKEACGKLILEAASILPMPEGVKEAMHLIAANPGRAQFSDLRVSNLLLQHAHNGSETRKLLADIPAGSRFRLPQNGKVYEKVQRNRTRYKCRLEDTTKYFLIGGAVPVDLMD